jgi:4-hydroxybenzoate polyprenyltransferase
MSDSNRFVTLKKSDRDFSKYLWGRVDRTVRAIPVQSLNVGLEDESVTFELKPIDQIPRPAFLLYWASLAKLKSYILFLFPLFYIVVKNYADDRFHDPFSLAFAFFAMCFTYAGLNMRNDIADHISGFDRVNIPFSYKPILLGWITASRLSKISWGFIFLGAVLSLPVLILQPNELKLLAAAIFLLFVGQFFRRNLYKEKMYAEVILFFLIGIGVTCGFQIAAGGMIDAECIALGFFWGTAVLFLVHINNFSHLLTSGQAGIKNTMTKLGFDNAKKFLTIWWVCCILVWIAFHILYGSIYWAWFTSTILIFWSIPLFIKLAQIRSPLGSDLITIRQSAHKTFLVMVAIFFAENVWYIGAKLNWNF